AAAKQVAELLADRHQHLEVGFVAAGERVGDHRHRRGLARRRCHLPAHLHVGFLDDGEDLAHVRFHRSPSSPLISLALRPPARSWTRAPVVITRISTISSARVASTMPTSMALKWP